MIAAVALASCGKEARTLGSDQPLTAPLSAGDRRIAYFQQNVSQVGQGGRYFGWYGCGACHDAGAKGWLDLSDGRWRYGGAFDQIYHAIAQGHGGLAYSAHIPVQSLWQITAYVRSLSTLQRDQRVRQDRDAAGEPTAASWNGALR